MQEEEKSDEQRVSFGAALSLCSAALRSTYDTPKHEPCDHEGEKESQRSSAGESGTSSDKETLREKESASAFTRAAARRAAEARQASTHCSNARPETNHRYMAVLELPLSPPNPSDSQLLLLLEILSLSVVVQGTSLVLSRVMLEV